MTATLEQRLLRVEGLLGLKPSLGLEAGSEFWIVQATGTRGDRSLNYWGPFKTADRAVEAELFRAEFGCVVIEVPL